MAQIETQTRAERKAEFMTVAEQLYERLEDWYDAHAEASFGEIEQEARRRRRELMGSTLTTLINGRDTGYQAERPRCEQCQTVMGFEGYRAWRVIGLEGDTILRRAYYVCPDCTGQTIFPPGSKTEIASGSLE